MCTDSRHQNCRLHQNWLRLWFQIRRGCCWYSLGTFAVCRKGQPLTPWNYLNGGLPTSYWYSFLQPPPVSLCSLLVLISPLQRAFFHLLFQELNSWRDLPWNNNFQATLVSLIIMKNLIQDQHIVQSLSLSSILHLFTVREELHCYWIQKEPLPKLFCLALSISIDSTYHCRLSDSLPFSLSRHNIWNFLS